MKEFSLERTGKSKLVFEGIVIAHAISPAYQRHLDNPTARCHWFEGDLLRTKGGKYVAAISYRWSGKMYRETNFDDALPFPSEADAMKFFDDFEPESCVQGFPDGEYWNKKQAQLIRQVKEDYSTMVDLLEADLNQKKEPERVN